jgi:hypothetical protein
MDCVIEKVHTLGVGQACGEGETVGWSVAKVWYQSKRHNRIVLFALRFLKSNWFECINW